MRLSDKTLQGRAVISADGKVLGSVSELFITSGDWRLESVRIELRKDIADHIGAVHSMFHRGSIELPIAFIQSVGDAVVLTVDVDKLREVHRVPDGEPAVEPQSSP